MTLNYPAPYEVKITYTTTPTGFVTIPHVMSFNLPAATSLAGVGDPFGEWQFPTRSFADADLETITLAVIAALDNFYPASAKYVKAELFHYASGSFESEWMSVMELDQAGAGAGTSTPGHQITITARTNQGGIARWQLMESNATSRTKLAFPSGNASLDAIKNLMINPNMPFVGQDGGYLVAGNYASLTYNEKLEKKRWRD